MLGAEAGEGCVKQFVGEVGQGRMEWIEVAQRGVFRRVGGEVRLGGLCGSEERLGGFVAELE